MWFCRFHSVLIIRHVSSGFTFLCLLLVLEVFMTHCEIILFLSMHFIRGWPWQPSWSRVVSGVSMSRGSSNKVVEQQSSSSNTTAHTDTPSGTDTPQYTHVRYGYASIFFLTPVYLSIAAFLRKNRTRLLAKFWGFCSDAVTGEAYNSVHNLAHKTKDTQPYILPTHTVTAHCHICPHYTDANSWYCFTVPVKPLDGP